MAPHVILFAGHRIDAEGRKKRRFPHEKEDQARTMIREAVSGVKQKIKGKILGLAGCAAGGDILFHEVCQELEIPSQIYLALPKNDYIKSSVADAGPEWIQRFNHLLETRPSKTLTDSDELPSWGQAEKGGNIWQRSNVWMLHEALTISENHITLIALWNGERGDSPGGTEDMIQQVQSRGATFIHLDTRPLLQ